MPHAKKAAKKSAKKSAKKAAKHVGGEHGPEKHGKATRRAYEHLGRVRVLMPLVGREYASQVRELVEMAQTAVRANEAKDAADLLRGAEHLCFGATAEKDAKGSQIAQELVETIRDEHEHLLRRAENHAENDMSEALREIYELMTSGSSAAMDEGNLRGALELARGAEALAHVKGGQATLAPGRAQGRLAKKA